MKVKRLYQKEGPFEELTTAQLIEIGVLGIGGGQIEDIEVKLNHLIAIVAALIDRSGLSADDVLRITGSHYIYTVGIDD